MAKQASDVGVRAVLVEMAWKWLDLAELGEWDNWERAWRVRAIQTNIGRELRVHFDLPQDMPPPILARLMQIDAPQDGESGAAAGNGQSGGSSPSTAMERSGWFSRFSRTISPLNGGQHDHPASKSPAP
jgi:hypothetical protein